ncbi:MAG: hypothetical protein ACOX7G_00040 [Candidatus Scatomorpha sp.]|jgi:hypothetical protein
MGYIEENDALFAEWKKITGSVPECKEYGMAATEINHANKVFIRDGVVCPELWFAQRTRPLFLLKEAYNGDNDWDLVSDQLLTAESASRIWRRVAHWAYALLNTTAEEIAPYNPELKVSRYGNEYLRRIAAVNVKKSDGKNNSNMDEVRSYAWFDAERLWKQLSLCDPTVIVCGYTASALDIISERMTGKKVRETDNNSLYYTMELNGHKVLVLDYWHPANHFPKEMNYFGLTAVYQLGLKNCVLGE